MKQREKAILLIAAAAVAYAVYVLFLSGPPKVASIDREQELEAARTFVLDTSKILAADKAAIRDAYIIGRASMAWEEEPFLISELAIEEGASSETEEDQTLTLPFRYTGYISAGNKKLAVINGMEYEIGDVLDPGGHTIVSISPIQTIIETAEEQIPITLPMEDAATLVDSKLEMDDSQ